MNDYTLVENPDGSVACHRPDCIAVEFARQAGWPLLSMFDCKDDPFKVDHRLQRHDCLREETMSTIDNNAVLCPRCEKQFFRPYGSPAPQGANVNEIVYPPALSRMDNASYICSDCGDRRGDAGHGRDVADPALGLADPLRLRDRLARREAGGGMRKGEVAPPLFLASPVG